MADVFRCVKCGEWLDNKKINCTKCGESGTAVGLKSHEYSSAFFSKVCCVTDKYYPKGGLKKIYVRKGNNILIYWMDPKLELDTPNEAIPVYTFRKFISSVSKKRKEIND